MNNFNNFNNNIAKNSKYDEYQKGLASMVYKFFEKKSAFCYGVKNKNMSKQELANE